MADAMMVAVRTEAARIKAAKLAVKTELKKAKTLQELKALAKARGYNEGWAELTFKLRMETRAKWARERAELLAAADCPGALEINR